MIVDDDPFNLKALTTQLKSFKDLQLKSMPIDEAIDGSWAIEIYKKRLELAGYSNWNVKPYKVIFMDYNMP